MTYLLIALVLLLILSSLAWIKPSARQKQLAEMRRYAASEGLQVKLHKAPDARDGEGRLDHALYLLGWPPGVKQTSEPQTAGWLLVKGSRRGDPSKWDNWRWISKDASPQAQDGIAAVLQNLPSDVDGLAVDNRGLGVYWQERGELADVGRIVKALQSLRSFLVH